MSDADVEVRVEHGVAHITLHRPEVLNRFEGTMRESLLTALRAAADDPGVRCVRITGSPPAFSAGADIEGMLDLHHRGEVAEIRRRVGLGAEIVALVRAMAEPVVAAVGGAAAGAGANLALACDVRIGSEHARFVEGFVHIGLVPDWGGFRSLVELVGRGHAADLMMTGRAVDADRALALGILQQVVPADELESTSTAYCEGLARSSAPALAAIKRGLALASDGAGGHELAAFEAEQQSTLFATAECRQGMEAFLARRTGSAPAGAGADGR